MGSKLDLEEEGINDINITPFVDVVLVLLVIFMVTAPVMLKDSLKVKLPKTLTSDKEDQSSVVGIAITASGQILLNGVLFSEENLKNELKKIADSNLQTHFLISADVETKHGDLVRMIDLLKQFDLNQFALQVEKIKKK